MKFFPWFPIGEGECERVVDAQWCFFGDLIDEAWKKVQGISSDDSRRSLLDKPDCRLQLSSSFLVVRPNESA